MSAMVAQRLGPVSNAIIEYQKRQAVQDDLGAGIQSGFAVVSYRGKVWRIKHGGTERDLTNEDGSPRFYLDVVILKASPILSKIFYEKGYEEGSTAAPDCFSVNGVTPDPASPKKQAQVCAACPHNAFGTRRLANGEMGKGKACQDSKRLAVVPAGDIDNEALDGPMLLRVPAGSFKDLKTYADAMNSQGFPYYGVATRISFDMKQAFPQLVFRPLHALNDEEAARVLSLRDGPDVARVLNEAAEATQAQAPAEPEPDQYKIPARQEPAPVTQQVTPAPKVEPKVEPKAAKVVTPAAPAPAPQPAVQAKAPEPVAEVSSTETGDGAPASFDDMLANLMGD